eukprot:CAMPEP_0174737520 /NCGR_PEP_ID=MMETSP1094-20130205/68427_1 /TAXON_ID=156173 /ORGANISM="Chrysochromulina brevifilum, Strain UTEX LB 985" /LENGTH=274 /DNA_ID=CAMNT_0015940761 /DNA_START=227 /DNA_END=1049 /DNA_ORIENTATION=-
MPAIGMPATDSQVGSPQVRSPLSLPRTSPWELLHSRVCTGVVCTGVFCKGVVCIGVVFTAGRMELFRTQAPTNTQLLSELFEQCPRRDFLDINAADGVMADGTVADGAVSDAAHTPMDGSMANSNTDSKADARTSAGLSRLSASLIAPLPTAPLPTAPPSRVALPMAACPRSPLPRPLCTKAQPPPTRRHMIASSSLCIARASSSRACCKADACEVGLGEVAAVEMGADEAGRSITLCSSSREVAASVALPPFTCASAGVIANVSAEMPSIAEM